MQFATEFERVFARGVRNVIDELGDVVGSLELRPLEGAEAGDESAGESDARETSGERPAYSGVRVRSRMREC